MSGSLERIRTEVMASVAVKQDLLADAGLQVLWECLSMPSDEMPRIQECSLWSEHDAH